MIHEVSAVELYKSTGAALIVGPVNQPASEKRRGETEPIHNTRESFLISIQGFEITALMSLAF